MTCNCEKKEDNQEKITIISIRKPSEKNLNRDLQWFSESLGLFNERDKERSCFRIFVELIKATRRKTALSSDEIAARANLSRGTIIHHLNKLVDSGLIISYQNRYLLRVDNLEELVGEIQKDVLRTLNDLKQIALDLDDELGLLKRKKNKKRILDF